MIDFLLKRRRVILFILIPLILFGLYSLFKMPIKLYPNTRKPLIMVDIPHPSFTAEDFYDNYGELIEQKLNAVTDLDFVTSTYSSGKNEFDVEFNWGVDIEIARARVLQQMDSIKNQLPEESENFRVFFSRFFTSYVSIAVTSEKRDFKDIFGIVNPVFLRTMTKIEDAESIELIDIEDLTAEIRLDNRAVISNGLTSDEIIQAIRSGYRHQSLGSFDDGKNRYSLRINKGIDSIFEIENILISVKGNKKIFLKDIATVSVKYDLPRNLYRTNGKNTVLILAIPKQDGNLKNLSGDIKKAIKEAKKELPDDIEFTVLLDPAEFVDKSINNVLVSALTGGLLAIILIFFILGEFKNTLIIGLSIPLTIILSFILMNAFKLTINLISLSGITLAVGMIVDSSVVIMENLHRHRLENPSGDLRRVIIISVKEVANAVVASTVTSICVFLPLSFTAPLANAIMGELAKTIIFTLIFAMLISLTVIPVVYYYLYRKTKVSDKPNKLTLFSTNIMRGIINIYSVILRAIIKKKSRSLALLTGSFAALIILFIFVLPLIRKEIIADPKSDRVSFRFRKFNCTDKMELLQSMEPIEKDILEKYKDIITTSNVNFFSNDSGRILFKLKSSKYMDYLIEKLNDEYQTNTDWRYDIFPWDPARLPLPRTYDLMISINGPDREQKTYIMEKIIDLINKEQLYRSVFAIPNTSRSNEVMLIPRYEIVKEFPSYQIARLGNIIKFLLNGSNVLNYNINNKKINVLLAYPDKFVTSMDDIKKFNLYYNDKSIPISHFFHFDNKSSLSEMHLVDGKESFGVYAYMKRDDPKYKRGEFENKIKKIIQEKLEIEQGYSYFFEDTQEVINDSISSLLVALLMSIILIFVVLGIQFNSARIPLIIIVSIPLGLIGVISSLFIFNSTISLNSLLGMILLAGIVVNNSIIIIDFYLSQKAHFTDKIDLIIHIGKLRFTPIIMTSLTTILGMLPLALAIGDGTNIIQPLGIAVCGGLFVSTFLTLFIIPAILSLIDIKVSD